MEKILDNIAFIREYCEIGFISCFTVMYMKAENIKPSSEDSEHRGWCTDFLRRCTRCGRCDGSIHGAPSLHHLFGTVSGIALVQPDLSSTTFLEQEIDRSFGQALGALDDCVDFLCRFAGYTYTEAHGVAGRKFLFQHIKKTVDQNKAAILQYEQSNDWVVVIGYREKDMALYVLCKETAGDRPQQHIDCLEDWFSDKSRVITLDKKTSNSMTSKDIYARLYRLMKQLYDSNSFPNSKKYLLDDDYFNGLDEAGLQKEHTKLFNYFYGLVTYRCVAGWYFDNPYELNNSHWGEIYSDAYRDIALACSVIHDLGHITNGSILGGWYHANPSIISALRNRKERTVLAHALELTYTHNNRIMSLLHQLAMKG